MSQNICECHCGTRIDLDEQLLEEREMWKEKYLCLQKQFKVDIQTLKENIYAECSAIMQQEFLNKENEHNRFVNQKNIEVKDLIAKIISLETQVKVLTKEKELSEHRLREVESLIEDRDETIINLKNRASNDIRSWEQRHDKEIVETRERLTHQAKEGIEKVEGEKEGLKQKLKEFEMKYQKMIPEVEKIKNALVAKTTQNDQLHALIEKLQTKQEDQSKINSQRLEDLERIHSKCEKHIKDLSLNNEELMRELDKCKKISRDVRVEPVYIDRPVEVERVVEKIVEIERIVNKFVDNPNNDKRVKSLEDENQKLREELNILLREIKEIEENFQRAIHDLEDNIKSHEKNADLYKSERESLALRLNDQNKEIELLHNFVERLGADRVNKPQNDGEKIVVHVKQDGTYQKTVERLPAQVAPIKKKK